MRENMKKRLLLGFICAVILFILVITNDGDFTQIIVPLMISSKERDISCYIKTSEANGLQEFDATKDSDRPKFGNNIFFHETSCFDNDELMLNARQACAVESAARMNRKMTVYLLFMSPSKISESSKQLVRQLLSYENIKIRRLYMNNYVKHTPLEEWYDSGILRTSRWPKSHMSDILRYLTLWKFGGIYLDLDVVVTTSLEKLKNFSGAEDWEDVAAGVIGFGMDNLGRRVADACVRDLKRNFKGNVWGNNGPGVITRILQKLCDTKYARDMTPIRCNGFKVFPPSAFYPIGYKNWTKYFETSDINETMEIIKNSKAIHVWNKFSHERQIKVGSQVPYSIIAQKYCPKVYNNCGTIF